jgi:hypothetical protein
MMARRAVYRIEPHIGVGPVRLAMTRNEARAAMLASSQSCQEDPHAKRDLYHRNAFQVFYDATETVEYIELSRGGDFDATFAGERILEIPADDAVRFVESFAPYSTSDPELGWSYVFPALDLSLWRPVTGGEEGRTFATVGVGRAGYYAGV